MVLVSITHIHFEAISIDQNFFCIFWFYNLLNRRLAPIGGTIEKKQTHHFLTPHVSNRRLFRAVCDWVFTHFWDKFISSRTCNHLCTHLNISFCVTNLSNWVHSIAEKTISCTPPFFFTPDAETCDVEDRRYLTISTFNPNVLLLWNGPRWRLMMSKWEADLSVGTVFLPPSPYCFKDFLYCLV